jgi:hypothetical protein
MVIMVIARGAGLLLIAILVVMVARRNHRIVAPTWGSLAAGQCTQHRALL